MIHNQLCKLAYMETFGDRIKSSRETKGVTQGVLAKAVGVSREAVSQWEGGAIKSLKPENLFAVADYLEVDARWVATGEAERIAEDKQAYFTPKITKDLSIEVARRLKGPLQQDWLDADVHEAGNMLYLLINAYGEATTHGSNKTETEERGRSA